jgi:hypothetical protein
MNYLNIMVQIADRSWTLDALGHACLMAHDLSAEIALIKFHQVQHVSLLGTEFGYMNLKPQDCSELRDYRAIIEEFGVPCSTHVIQYITLVECVLETADYVDACIVFATLPKSIIPFWQRLQLHRLRNGLARAGRELFDANRPSATRPSGMVKVPSISIGDVSN